MMTISQPYVPIAREPQGVQASAKTLREGGFRALQPQPQPQRKCCARRP